MGYALNSEISSRPMPEHDSYTHLALYSIDIPQHHMDAYESRSMYDPLI